MHDSLMARERLSALLSQEESYSCPNYMAPDFARPEQTLKPTPLRIVEECAKLVSNLALEPPSRFQLAQSPSSITSTTLLESATEVPSILDHCHLKEWRRQMASWAYTTVDTFGLDRELVAVAFDMLDRYLSREIKTVDCNDHFTREDFQLTSMTTLYMAIKILEPSEKLSIPTLIDMSRGYYCAEDITETEMEILQVLEWRVNVPTTLSFIQEVASLMPATFCSKDMMDSCQELSEAAVMDEYFVGYKASVVSAAVMLTAARRHGLDMEGLKTQVIQRMNVDTDEVKLLCKHFER